MTLRELIEKAAKTALDNDVAIECDHKLHHVKFAKRANYNKRDMKFTSRMFLLVAE